MPTTVRFSAGPHRLSYNSSAVCIHSAGQAFGDRVIRVAHDDLEGQPASMIAATRRTLVEYDLAVFVAHARPELLGGPIFPAADGGHQAVFLPLRKGIVGGVIGDEASAVANVVLERGLCLGGPGIPVVIGNHDGVLRKIRFESAHVLAFRRTGRNINRESPRLFQEALEHGRGLSPSVIVLAVHDQRLQRRRSNGKRLEQKQHCGWKNNSVGMHDFLP